MGFLGKSFFCTTAFLCALATSKIAFADAQTHKTKSPAVKSHLFINGEALGTAMATWVKAQNSTDPTKIQKTPNLLATLRGPRAFEEASSTAAKLKSWLLEQPEHSVYPDQLYSQAIILAQGNVQLGLKAAWNTLCESAEAYDRNEQEHIQKLADITGERAYFHGKKITVGSGIEVNTTRGDNFAAWYHFTGIALYTYTGALTFPSSPALSELRSRTFAFIENNVYFDIFIDNEKRGLIDQQGAIFGARLASELKNSGQKTVATTINPATYLYEDPTRYSKEYALRAGENSADFFKRNPRSMCLLSLKQAIFYHGAKFLIPGL